MIFTITIETDNDAFQLEFGDYIEYMGELSRSAVERVLFSPDGQRPIFDTNGNTVGRIEQREGGTA